MKKRNCKIGTAVELKGRGEKGVITQIDTYEKGWCLVDFGEGAVYHCNHKRLRLAEKGATA